MTGYGRHLLRNLRDSMIRWIRCVKLQPRFIGIIMAATVVPLLLLELLTFLNVKGVFQQSNFDNIQKELDLYNVLVDTKLEEYGLVADKIATSLDTIKIASKNYNKAQLEHYVQLAKYNTKLDAWCAELDDFLTLEVAGNQEVLAIKPYRFMNPDLQQSKIYQKVLQGENRKVYLGACELENHQNADMPPNRDENQHPLLVSSKVKSAYSNSYVGSVNLYIKESMLTKLLEKAVSYEQIKDSPFQLSSIFIVDQNNYIISHKNKIRIGQKLPDELIENLKRNSPDNPASRKVVRRDTGQKQLLFYSDSRVSGFRIISMVDYNIFFREIDEIRNEIVLLSLIFAGIAALWSYLHSLSIQDPIYKIVKGMKEVERNNLSVRIEDKGKDELHYLTHRFNKMVAKTDELLHQTVQNAVEKKEAELRILEEQINPHFLYNTLDMISWMAYQENHRDICHMVNSLSSFFRLGLNSGQRMHSVQCEVDHVRAYIEIQRERFKGKIAYYFQVEEETLHYETVKIILQPVVENAIVHGIIPKGESGTIWIEVYRQNTEIIFRVEDDGVGLKENHQKGHGSRNIDTRIKLQYGNRYGLSLYARVGAGTVAEIRIPAILEQEEHFEDFISR